MPIHKHLFSAFLAAFLILSSTSAQSQDDYTLIKELDFTKSKKFVEDFVVERMKLYYIHNVDDCWKTIRKKRGINLKKESKRTAFLAELENDIRTQLQRGTELSHVNLYPKYNVHITEIIGRYGRVSGLAPYNGTTGSGHFNIGFVKEKIQFMTFTLRTTTAYSKFSGVEYLPNVITGLRNDFKKLYPNYTESSYKGSTNVCSADKGEPQYNFVFAVNKPDQWQYSLTYEFGPMVRDNNAYSCTYLGNHLTGINVFWWNNKVKP